MNNKTPIDQLSAIFGSSPQKEKDSTNEVVGIFLQVSLAILFPILMMALLFMSQAKAQLNEAKGQIGYWQGIYEEVAKTPAGELYQKFEESLIKLQQQRLILALYRVEAEEREHLGLSFFSKKKEDGSIEFIMDEILSGGKIVSKRFISGCELAKKTIPYPAEMRNNWLKNILISEGMQLGRWVPIAQNFEVLTLENEAWLKNEISQRLDALVADSINMQRSALAQLLEYYRKNTILLKGTKVYKLIERYPGVSSEEQERLVPQIQEGLYEYVKSVFEKQNVFLLGDV